MKKFLPWALLALLIGLASFLFIETNLLEPERRVQELLMKLDKASSLYEINSEMLWSHNRSDVVEDPRVRNKLTSKTLEFFAKSRIPEFESLPDLWEPTEWRVMFLKVAADQDEWGPQHLITLFKWAYGCENMEVRQTLAKRIAELEDPRVALGALRAISNEAPFASIKNNDPGDWLNRQDICKREYSLKKDILVSTLLPVAKNVGYPSYPVGAEKVVSLTHLKDEGVQALALRLIGEVLNRNPLPINSQRGSELETLLDRTPPEILSKTEGLTPFCSASVSELAGIDKPAALENLRKACKTRR